MNTTPYSAQQRRLRADKEGCASPSLAEPSGPYLGLQPGHIMGMGFPPLTGSTGSTALNK
jgi:hypothetical protein